MRLRTVDECSAVLVTLPKKEDPKLGLLELADGGGTRRS